MKVITKDYLENTLKNFTNTVSSGVVEKEELPETKNNVIYNIPEKYEKKFTIDVTGMYDIDIANNYLLSLFGNDKKTYSSTLSYLYAGITDLSDEKYYVLDNNKYLKINSLYIEMRSDYGNFIYINGQAFPLFDTASLNTRDIYIQKTLQKTYSKDLQVNLAPVETTLSNYKSLVKNGINPDITYYVTDEDEGTVEIEQTYNSSSTNAASGMAIAQSVENIVDKTSTQTISGVKTFDKISIGSFTFSNVDGTVQIS